MTYLFYDPHPHVCRMQQYECCKNHTNCPLYHRCKELKGYAEASKVCKKDCATCDYTGCTMSMENRKIEPLYVNGFIMAEPLPLSIELEREKERLHHYITHRKNYVFYNTLFGDFRERRNKQQRDRYHADLEFSRQRAREWYRAHYVKQVKPIPESILPECQLNCENCKHEDCVLPEDWRKKANQANWLKNNPDYFANYRKENRQLLREKGKDYYAQHRDERLTYQKEHRSKPEVKAQRAAYDKEYRKTHPEIEREKKRRYNERHRDKVLEQKKAYYEAHKDEINAKRRAQRAAKKLNGANPCFL